jgi:signal transduction histidine kinase
MDIRNLKILLVDDDEDDYIITRELLSDITGKKINLEWISSYDAALEAMVNNRYDICLVDYYLGELDGLTLLRNAVKNGCNAPIIFLTGQGDWNIDIEAMTAGAADYLDKSEINTPLLERSIRYAVKQQLLLRTLKQQALELHASESRLSTIIANNADGIVIMDKNGMVCFVNPAAENLFGRKSEELVGKVLVSFRETTETRELEFIGKNNKRAVIEMRVAKMDWKGETAYLASMRDITERKEAEEQIRQLTQLLIQTQEREREKFSMDLHDSVAQDLSALKINVDLFFDLLPEVPVKLKQKISECSNLLGWIIKKVRSMAYELSPSGLDHLGFVPVITEYCEEFSTQKGIAVDFLTAGINEERLDHDTKINLYRLIQESLTNVWKHADADKVKIRLVASFPNIILRIEDNGKGFDIEKRLVETLNEKRMGLRSMEGRISLLGGTMTIQSRKMQGTRILFKFAAG